MKKIWIGCLILAAWLSVSVTSVSAEKSKAADAGVLDTIRERGVLKIGTAGDYQPMSYLDPETNT